MQLKSFKRLVSKGREFKVSFMKRSGKIRNMNCKVIHNTKNMSYDPKQRGLLPVIDIDIDEFRLVNLKSLLGVEVNGKSYDYDPDKKLLVEKHTKKLAKA